MNNVELVLREAEESVSENKDYKIILDEKSYEHFSRLNFLYKGFKIQERVEAEVSEEGIKTKYHLTISRRKK